MRTVYGQKLYYNNEKTDDFTDFKAELNTPIDAKYKYAPKNPLFRLLSFLLYYVIATPILLLVNKVYHGIKIKGKKNLKKVKGGCVVFSNHVNTLDCAFSLVNVITPRRGYIVCNPDAVRMPVVRVLTKMLGALPVPDDLAAFRNFNDAVDGKLKSGKTLVVMPEAHIWPYYTGIRPFPSTSFTYAVRNSVPAVPVCVTYRKPKGPFKNLLKPRVTVWVGEPIYPLEGVAVKKNANYLRDKTYEFMTEMTRHNEVELYDYIKTDEPVNTRKQLAEVKRMQKLRDKARRHFSKFGKAVYREEYRRRIIQSLEAPIADDEELAYQYSWNFYNKR